MAARDAAHVPAGEGVKREEWCFKDPDRVAPYPSTRAEWSILRSFCYPTGHAVQHHI